MDNPDFHIDLGDTFMSEKLPAPIDYNAVVQGHLQQRSYFGLLCHSVPLFLVLGNHEGELGWKLNGTPDNVAVWTTNVRKLYYLNPVPDSFYSGNSITETYVGLRENYYAWEWGDALFIVLDPFWYTAPKPNTDSWGWTLGHQQYDWFKQVLQNSHAKFKFVFCHHLVGGYTSAARGGVEYAPYYEWGGKNHDDSWGFDTRRSGWGKPIHQLMVDNHVTIFFHGHDHLFVKQDLDGIVYQEVPQPSNRNYDATGSAAGYGYTHGVILGNSGHLRVRVFGSKVSVDYVRAYLPADETETRINRQVSYTYTIPPNRAPSFTSNTLVKPDATVGILYSSSIAGDASDPDPGDTLQFSRVNGRTWLSVNTSGTLAGTPSLPDVGLNSFIVRAKNAAGSSSQATLNITVQKDPSRLAVRNWVRY